MESDEVFLTGDSRGDSEIKRGLKEASASGLGRRWSSLGSLPTPGLCLRLPGQPGKGNFPAPELTLLRPLGMQDSTPH